jgi:hypothetical protein
MKIARWIAIASIAVAACTSPVGAPDAAVSLAPPDVPATSHPTQRPTVNPTIGPTALCNDGTYSYSATHSGTCSHHHGVAVWYR